MFDEEEGGYREASSTGTGSGAAHPARTSCTDRRTLCGVRSLAVLAALAAAAALLAGAAAGSGGPTALVITFWEDGREPETKVVRTLLCNPVGGSHPWRTRACARVARDGRALFLPTPPGMACAELFGGHQTALIRGHVDGRRVWSRFSRVDGCAITRWERVVPLLPATSGAS